MTGTRRDSAAFFGAVLFGLVTSSCAHDRTASPPPAPAPAARTAPAAAPLATAPPPVSPPAPAVALDTPAPVEGSPELKPGAVQMIQQRLESRGALPAQQANGELDAPTRAALARFQEANGLPATGEPDRETVRMLDLKERNIFEPAPGSSE